MRQLSQRAIHAFLITFRMGSISAASEALNLTQPAISRLLKDLEEDIGFPLFHRIRGRLHRTPEGVAFHEEVSRSFVGLDRLKLVADSIRQGHRFRLIVNMMPSLASTCMPRILAEFLAANPETILTAQPLLTEEVVRQVLDYECNFGIVETRAFSERIISLYVHQSPAMCILPPHHRLGSREVIEPQDLAAEVFIHPILVSQLGGLVARMLADQRVHCRSVIECTLAFLAQKLVMEGVGVSIIDPFSARLHAEQGGLVRPFSLQLLNSVSFVAREDSVLTEIEQRFVEMAIARLNSMIDNRALSAS